MTLRTETTGWCSDKLQAHHLERLAIVYVRQSTVQQVLDQIDLKLVPISC